MAGACHAQKAAAAGAGVAGAATVAGTGVGTALAAGAGGAAAIGAGGAKAAGKAGTGEKRKQAALKKAEVGLLLLHVIRTERPEWIKDDAWMNASSETVSIHLKLMCLQWD